MKPPPPSADYDVGYAKPPEHTRFQKGQSGNPKGRPKGKPNLGTSLKKAFSEKVIVTENGRRKAITKLDAASKQFANKAAQGDMAALRQFLSLGPLLEAGDTGSANQLDVDEIAVMNDLRAYLTPTADPSTPSSENSP